MSIVVDRRARVLRDLDREIDTTRAHLEALETARRAVARTVSREKSGVAKAPADAEPSLLALAARIMADGQPHAVEDVYRVLVREGVRTDRATVNSLLYRGSRRPGGPFALVSRGRYKLSEGEERKSALPQ